MFTGSHVNGIITVPAITHSVHSVKARARMK